jgi:primosomal protein N' (replication factor Y)
MYIVSVLIEHPVQSLDTTFDYLSKEYIKPGVRVKISFNRRLIVGYVEECYYTNQTKQELEIENGFRYLYINEVIDEEPLLNDELTALANQISKLTLSPRISCLQAMLPTQLKPASHKAVGIKYIKTVEFIKNGTPKTSKQQECLNYIQSYNHLSVKDIPYSTAILDNLERQGFIQYKYVENYRNPYTMHTNSKEVTLTDDQQYIVDSITSKKERVSLIHGVTGSGKTEVYLALANFYLNQNKSVIMLVPEISLTPMMVSSFKERFKDDVAILHSRLSSGEKYDEYRKIKRQEVRIVVGARSAIFAPIENIGLIILDEEHDSSYKQDSIPRYHTTQIAKMRAHYHHAQVVLGSATPSLESYSRAKKGVYDLYELKHRINNKPLPKVEIIDMIDEMKHKNYTLFSRSMREKIQETINKNEQVILLLNKRGYASFVRCNDCGEVVKCPHCDVTLTYHKEDHQLKCHYCDYSTQVVKKCPKCSSQNIKMIGYGTEKIEETITNDFIGARVIRYDNDTTKNKNGHLKLLEQFKNQEANILLGTQMIAKGLNFENVTFVGVLNADLSLNIPDFRASERTFQLLCQVAGRSGRANKSGSVMIQTYNKDHYVIECASQHDYNAFYEEEMKYRRIAKYPPYCHMVSMIIQSKNENNVKIASLDIASYLKKNLNNVQVLGPAQSTIYKMKDIYRQRILIKFFDGRPIYEHLNKLNDYYNKQNKGKVNIVCDFNPYSQI